MARINLIQTWGRYHKNTMRYVSDGLAQTLINDGFAVPCPDEQEEIQLVTTKKRKTKPGGTAPVSESTE